MKLVIIIAMIIVFITTYYILELGNFLIENAVICEELTFKPGIYDCHLDTLSEEMFVVALLVGLFLLMDFGTVVLLIKSWVF